ncbi:hypothetical protein GCM10018784_66290 [Streptomyces hydrogenans]|nr:hypothetical protein GCM10018784_66290 [Streptomyces hydrogenans]
MSIRLPAVHPVILSASRTEGPQPVNHPPPRSMRHTPSPQPARMHEPGTYGPVRGRPRNPMRPLPEPSRLAGVNESCITMRDIEGNEFCLD